MNRNCLKSYYDVAVIGGGVSGVSAAVAAAECGKSVILIEQDGGPGGTAVFAGCPVFDGFGAEGQTIVGGFAERFIDNLAADFDVVQTSSQGDTSAVQKPYAGTYSAPDIDILLTLNRMLKKAGVDVVYYATVFNVEMVNRIIKKIGIYFLGNTFEISAGSFVDATGDACLAKLAKLPTIDAPSEKGMTKTVLFQVSGVKDFDKAGLRAKFAELAKQKLFPYPAQDLFMGSRIGSDNDSLLLNATLIAGNPLDPVERTSMDMELREQIPVIIDWFKKYLPPLANCRFRSMASRIGVRAGRNLCGRETIRQTDLIENTPVAEPVARGRRSFGGHGISGFNSGANKFTAGSRSIPFGALLSPEADNYYCAGRGVSVEVEAITAVRLMICCMATGEAAGCAAALGAEKQQIPAYADLQKILLSRGAVL